MEMDRRLLQVTPPGKIIDAELQNFVNKLRDSSDECPPVLIFPSNMGPILRKNICYQAEKYDLAAVYIDEEDFKTVAVLQKKHLKKVLRTDGMQIEQRDTYSQQELLSLFANYSEIRNREMETPDIQTQVVETEPLQNQLNPDMFVMENPPMMVHDDYTARIPDFFPLSNSNPQNYYQYKLIEIEKDLFTMPLEYSLAHCVAVDLRMKHGIASQFRKRFGRIRELAQQNAQPGGIAVLEDNNRYIYYLVIKARSYGKPTMENLCRSLQNLRKHVEEYNVYKLAMNRIGCGLDRLPWSEVKLMIQNVFQNTNVEIVVCSIPLADLAKSAPFRCGY